jgi:hypothetical protein
MRRGWVVAARSGVAILGRFGATTSDCFAARNHRNVGVGHKSRRGSRYVACLAGCLRQASSEERRRRVSKAAAVA